MASTAGEMIERVSGAAGRAVGRAEAIADRVAPPEERRLIGRAMDLPLSKKFLLARRLWRDERVGVPARAPLIAGLAYAVLPVGLTPARFGPLRGIEKIAGLGILLWLLIRLAPQDVLAEHLDHLDRPGLLGRLRGRK